MKIAEKFMKISGSKRMRLAAAGLISGAANGFFGAGGGMLLVPLLSRFIGLPDDKALATSLSVMLPLSALSAAVYLIRGGGAPEGLAFFLAGGFLGGIAAGRLFRRVPTWILKKVFGAFLIYAGIRALLP